MRTFAWLVLIGSWAAWGYPFVFRVPHYQKRPSITATAPTLIGLALECLALFMAFAFRVPGEVASVWWRVAPALVLGAAAAMLAWTATQHLGRQFRIRAGLYEDHRLVSTGPYALVRHPIYTSLLAILLVTLLILTRWEWALAALPLYFAGTEIRVRTEDKLLESRFGDEFRRYRRRVRGYIPFVR
jgi:protein-S-isoprenylcysteine O-methyltransferase Ste14